MESIFETDWGAVIFGALALIALIIIVFRNPQDPNI